MNKKNIVFVPMVADILHEGHIKLINKAKKYGQITVGLLTDKATKVYKTSTTLKYNQRLVILKSIKFIHKIEKTEDWDYASVLDRLKPKYVVHGDDWKKNNKVQRKNVINRLKKWRGRLIEFPYTKGVSSTLIKKKIIKENISQLIVKRNKRK